jgi:hypothetical protein
MIDPEWPRTWLVALTHRLARRSATTHITGYAPWPLAAPCSVTAIPTPTSFEIDHLDDRYPVIRTHHAGTGV